MWKKPSTAHRPLIDRSSTAIKYRIDRISRSNNLRLGFLLFLGIQKERSMRVLPAVDERSMSGR